MSETTAPAERADDSALPPGVQSDLRERIEDAAKDFVPPERMPQLLDRAVPAVVDVIESVQIEISGRLHSGPLPPPDILREYENAFPGAAERIFAMAEKDQDGFLDAQKDKFRRDDRYRIIGLALGFASLLLILAAVLWLTIAGFSGVATAVVGLGVAGIIGTFVHGARASTADPVPAKQDSVQ